jgi:hypothetical protein
VAYVRPWGVIVSFTEGCIFLFSLLVCWTPENYGIGDEGAVGIAKGLEKNTSLTVLSLGSVFPPYLFVHSLSHLWESHVVSHSHVMDEL